MRNPFHILANFLECQLIQHSKGCRVPPMFSDIGQDRTVDLWQDVPDSSDPQVLVAAANSLHFLNLEAIYPNIRFSCEAKPDAARWQVHLPGPRGRRNEAIPSLTLCKACSWRKLVLGLLWNRVLALGDHRSKNS